MLRITIKTKEGKQDIDLPQGWDELTWGKAMAIADGCPNEQPWSWRIGILTGLGQDFWREFQDLQAFNQLVQATEWVNSVYEYENMEARAWHKVDYQGKTYELPLDVGLLPAGLFEDARGLVAAMFGWIKQANEDPDSVNWKDFMTDSETLFKMYFQYVKDGSYNVNKVKAMSIDEVLYFKVIRWRDFFLKSMIASLHGTPTTSKKSKPQRMKWWQGIRKSVSSLVSRSRSTASRAATSTKKTASSPKVSIEFTEKFN